MSTTSLDTISAFARQGRADPLGACVRGLAEPGLWEVDCGTRESYFAVAGGQPHAMRVGMDHHEVNDPMGAGWLATKVERLTGTLFGGRATVEVLPCGDAVRVLLCMPRLTDDTAEGLPTITTDSGLYYDLAALDSAVAEALGLDVGALENPGATFTLDGEMLWTWTVAAEVAS